jgi:hypothetical protein
MWLRLFQNSESFERATLDVHGDKSQVIIIERLVICLQKSILKSNRLLKAARLSVFFDPAFNDQFNLR